MRQNPEWSQNQPIGGYSSPYLIERFVRRFRSAVDKMKRLTEWSRMGVKHNLIEMSLFGPETVMLTEYLAALKGYNRTKEDVFREMCTFFELVLDSQHG